MWGEFDDIAYEAFGEEGEKTAVDKQREEMDRTFAEVDPPAPRDSPECADLLR